MGFRCREYCFSAGDISFHLGWTFHGARANTTPETRKVFTIVYMEEDIHLTEPRVRIPFEAISQNWCPGCKPGDVLSSSLNPVLFRKSQALS
jgi:hypothetical protein